jgi:hypothetical protein
MTVWAFNCRVVTLATEHAEIVEMLKIRIFKFDLGSTASSVHISSMSLYVFPVCKQLAKLRNFLLISFLRWWCLDDLHNILLSVVAVTRNVQVGVVNFNNLVAFWAGYIV